MRFSDAPEGCLTDERVRLSGCFDEGEADEGEGEDAPVDAARPKRERLEAEWDRGAERPSARESGVRARCGARWWLVGSRGLDEDEGGGRVHTGWCASACSQGAMARKKGRHWRGLVPGEPPQHGQQDEAGRRRRSETVRGNFEGRVSRGGSEGTTAGFPLTGWPPRLEESGIGRASPAVAVCSSPSQVLHTRPWPAHRHSSTSHSNPHAPQQQQQPHLLLHSFHSLAAPSLRRLVALTSTSTRDTAHALTPLRRPSTAGPCTPTLPSLAVARRPRPPPSVSLSFLSAASDRHSL